ncbi:hypothetical protein N0B16_04370 [Chryseobacterium sp. GMJ5]|uniref:DUF4238 domain-containing protein n=1 Tax=Chryseobacterium gilvum TaxID=2976534 RepID=A0ABT2VVL8_9FLAO|nr:hypothetical protein [Chryseobacterium gilvum]MCU7613664.1 hypothetical protein [Chryseobacterium gilvum]
MATYESFLKINGSVGDLVFYTLNGKNIVRKKSGFNKSAFKKNPAYEKVRQNSSEFGHCSKIGKLIRQSIKNFIIYAEDPLLYQKFAKLMTEIKDLDFISERGKRTVKNGIDTEKGKSALRNFCFGKIDNISVSTKVVLNLWDNSLFLSEAMTDEIVITTIKIDFDRYSTETYEQIIQMEKQKNELVFTKCFTDDHSILHFITLKKDGEIIQMGFA